MINSSPLVVKRSFKNEYSSIRIELVTAYAKMPLQIGYNLLFIFCQGLVFNLISSRWNKDS